MIEGKIRMWRWQLGARAKQLLGTRRSFSGGGRRRVLLLSQPNNIAQSQIFPFHFYADDFRRKGYSILEMSTADFERQPDYAPLAADVVLVQAKINQPIPEVTTLMALVRRKYPAAKIAFLDYYAPTDLRYADAVNPFADLYLKKHVLRDRSQYLRQTRGDTNLVDYYGRLYGMHYEPVINPLPTGFFEKLKIVPSFCTSPTMLPNFYDSAVDLSLPPRIDVHGRLGHKGVDWYQAMRESAIAIIESMQDVVVISRIGTGRRQYMAELRSARICISPFGYGEVCWRDYEAVMCGALLLKPDMSHLETDPHIFLADETYVPIKWDFSDLESQIRWFLGSEDRRRSITRRAYERLHRYARENGFVTQVEPLLRA